MPDHGSGAALPSSDGNISLSRLLELRLEAVLDSSNNMAVELAFDQWLNQANFWWSLDRVAQQQSLNY
jgi:hypothetical protein